MKRLVAALLGVLLFAGVTHAATAKDIEASFAKGQAAFKENRLDDAAREFGAAADGLAGMKQTDKARAVYGNVAIIRMKQERWQDALDVYAKALALPGKTQPDALVKMTRNIVVCAEKTGQPEVKAGAIATMLAAKPALSPEDTVNFLAMQGDAYRAAERYALACQAYEKALASKNLKPATRLALLTGLGLSQGNLGRYPKALTSLEAARKEAEAVKAPMPLVESTSNIGVLYWEMGRYDKAASSLSRALAYAKEFSLRRNEGVDANNLGLVYKNAGKLPEASGWIDQALAIAREVKNRRDEAIALSNRALLARMNGDSEAALRDYTEALSIYREVKFREGEASTLMGLARLDMTSGKNYPAALDKLTQAAALYEELGNPGFLAEAYVQLGFLYQKVATPKRTSRDLVFEEAEPTIVEISPAEAIAQSGEYFAKALPLAEQTGRKEMIWSALHGLAFAAVEQGDLAGAEGLYGKAITVVLSMKGAEENPDLLMDFLRDKDDLFAQAISVCARLYKEKNDPALLKKQMEYDEIYRNEVMRANMKMAAINYADPKKRALYDDIVRLSASKKKAEAAANATKGDKGEAAKSENVIASGDAASIAKEYEAKLAQWKKQYPQDAVLFDSAAAVDTTKLQAKLAPDQAIVQYIPLDDSLVILVTAKDVSTMVSVPVSYKDLAILIRDRFIAENIEDFGHAKMDEKLGYEQAVKLLEEMASYMYEPVRETLQGKDRLYFLTSKYLSYVPFSALVTGRNADGSPRYLVEEKTVSLTRLSFLQQALMEPKKAPKGTSIIAVGDPKHDSLEVVLPRLDGAKVEAENAVKTIKTLDGKARTSLFTDAAATKSAWKKDVAANKYSVMYFATHGIPYAEMKHDYSRIKKAVKKADEAGRNTIGKRDIGEFREFISLYEKTFTNHSHLNGFLFLAYPDAEENGMLTLREIMELPDSAFENADLAVLSACNTAVSYSPKVVKNENVAADLEAAEASAELAAAGWTPGVDQVCLVDTFMKRNFRNVYGTLWFADDTASSQIMSDFLPRLKDTAPAEALRAAQLSYLKNPPKGLSEYPTHPYFWACGNIFGQ